MNSPLDGKLESWRSGSLRGASAKPRVLFGSVYEDAAIEARAWQLRLDELQNAGRKPRAFCIASGGDTLFSLLLPGVGRVDGVDINPAQIWLCALKVAARQTLSPDDFTRATAGDARPFYSRLRPSLDEQARLFWDDNRASLRHGLNGCGVVDGVMRRASLGLRWLIGRRAVRALLAASSLETQRQIWRTRANARRFAALFGLALHPLLLRAFYGAALREGLPLDLGDRIRANLERTLTDLPIQNNPLHQPIIARTFALKPGAVAAGVAARKLRADSRAFGRFNPALRRRHELARCPGRGFDRFFRLVQRARSHRATKRPTFDARHRARRRAGRVGVRPLDYRRTDTRRYGLGRRRALGRVA